MWISDTRLSGYKIEIEKKIQSALRSRNKDFQQLLSQHVMVPGKMLRPFLLVLSALQGQPKEEHMIQAAAAIEILHNATLLHDDVIDNAPLRRGLPTVHSKYGIDMSVYAGDYLLVSATYLVCDLLPPEHLKRIIGLVKEICEGEVLQYQRKFDTTMNPRTYFKIIARKTALLFAAASGLGANIGGLDDDWVKQHIRLGFYYGMAFQIRDDILDLTSSTENIGKNTFQDILEGYFTLPVLYAMKKDPNVTKTIQGFRSPDITPHQIKEDLRFLHDFKTALLSTHCIADAKHVMEKRYLAKAEKILQILPRTPFSEALQRFVLKTLSHDI